MDNALDAAILCGGLGTRLRGLGLDLPKAMLPVAGRPFLESLVLELVRQGVGRVVLCTGFRHEVIEAHFARGEWGADIAFSRESEPLGTAGALRLALPRIVTDPFLALNGDSFTPFDLAALRARAATTGAPATLVVAPANDRGDAGAIALDPRGYIRAFAEKQALAGARYHNAGIYLLRREIIAALPADRPVSLEREVLPALVGRGVATLPSLGDIIDIGTPERLVHAQALLAQLRR